MMQLTLSAPSKTFLVGEYAALAGGPCLMLNTEPRFEGVFLGKGTGACLGIHPKSPAGLWVRAHREHFQDVDFEFKDPHEGRGGFGASGAQFLFVWAWSSMREKGIVSLDAALNPKQALADFLETFDEVKGRPSGADVFSQALGGLAYISLQPTTSEHIEWPFADLKPLIVPTGVKLKTHSHLKELEAKGLQPLRQLSGQVAYALKDSNRSEFLNALKAFADELSKQEKVAVHTKTMIENFSVFEGVELVKGCGAMGSDVVLVLCQSEHETRVRERILESGNTVLAGLNDLSGGLKLSVEMGSQTEQATGIDL